MKKTTGLSPADLRICARFKETRTEAKLSQAEFAFRLGTNVSYIKAVEQGKFAPNFTIMRRWARLFSKDFNWIIDGRK